MNFGEQTPLTDFLALPMKSVTLQSEHHGLKACRLEEACGAGIGLADRVTTIPFSLRAQPRAFSRGLELGTDGIGPTVIAIPRGVGVSRSEHIMRTRKDGLAPSG